MSQCPTVNSVTSHVNGISPEINKTLADQTGYGWMKLIRMKYQLVDSWPSLGTRVRVKSSLWPIIDAAKMTRSEYWDCPEIECWSFADYSHHSAVWLHE